MNLTTSEAANLILTIENLIREAKVTRSGRVYFSSSFILAETIRERIGEDLDTRFSEAMGDIPLLEFLRLQITRELLSSDEDIQVRELIKHPSYRDSVKVARRIVEKIEKLPSTLRILTPLPRSFSGMLFNELDKVEIGPGVQIVSAASAISETNFVQPSNRLNELIYRRVDISELPTDFCHYFCTWHSGYAGALSAHASSQDHQDRLRGFLGCLLSLEVVEQDFFVDTLKQHAVITVDSSSGSIVAIAEPVDSDLSSFFENFDPSLPFFRSLENGRSVEDHVGEEIDVDDNRDVSSLSWPELTDDDIEKRTRVIDNIKKIFAKDDHSRRLFTSALWLFRSFVSTRALDIILEATISLEVLLGDRQAAASVGLTKLLGNRCAYLLGNSADHRAQLMEEFSSIYEIRSGIVHSGLHQMGKRATQTSMLARDLASQVLRKELSLAPTV